MCGALDSLPSIARVRPSHPAKIAPGNLSAEPPRPGGRRAAMLRWIPLTLALLVGCGGSPTTTLAPAENPPATPQERAQKNPKLKADLEANSKRPR